MSRLHGSGKLLKSVNGTRQGSKQPIQKGIFSWKICKV